MATATVSELRCGWQLRLRSDIWPWGIGGGWAEKEEKILSLRRGPREPSTPSWLEKQWRRMQELKWDRGLNPTVGSDSRWFASDFVAEP